jgi:hypothetical protein
MATVEKDFKVKNGLIVNSGGSFGGAVVVSDPTESTHAATKSYVDSVAGKVDTGSVEPSSPIDGTQWFDTSVDRLKIYYNGSWFTQAAYIDTINIPQHIHDTSIGGSGLVVSVFTNGGQTGNDPQINYIDSGGAYTLSWDSVLDGGIATSNYV